MARSAVRNSPVRNSPANSIDKRLPFPYHSFFMNVMFHCRSVAAAALLFAAASASAQSTVRVTGDHVNLRAAPAVGDVVAQAAYDDRLSVVTLGDEWVEVLPPPSAALWVSKDYVTPQNTIGANRVNVRAGNSVNYNVVTVLTRGTPVTPLEELEGWLRIAPPEQAHLWISREFLEVVPDSPAPAADAAAPAPPAPPAPPAQLAADVPLPPSPADTALLSASPDAPPARPAPKPRPSSRVKNRTATPSPDAILAAADSNPAPILPSSPGTPIVSPSTPVPDVSPREIPPPPPADLHLVPLDGQGKILEFEGILRAAPLINEAPTHFRVVRWQNNRWQILCHVYGEASVFRRLKDEQVRVRGRVYWIQKAAAPVLCPDWIQKVDFPANANER